MRGVLIQALLPFRVHAGSAVTLAFPESPRVTPEASSKLFTSLPTPAGLLSHHKEGNKIFFNVTK